MNPVSTESSLQGENCGSGRVILDLCNKTLLVCVEKSKAKEINCLFGVCDALTFLWKFAPFLDQDLRVVFATRISFCIKFLCVRGLKTLLVPSDHSHILGTPGITGALIF